MSFTPITRDQLRKMKEEYETHKKNKAIEEFVNQVRKEVLKAAAQGGSFIAMYTDKSIRDYLTDLESILSKIFIDCDITIDNNRQHLQISWF